MSVKNENGKGIVMFCESCGESIQSTAKFCAKCGRAIDIGSSVPVATPNAETIPKTGSKKFSLARWYFGLTSGQRIFLWIASVLSIFIAGIGFIFLAILIFLHLGHNPDLPPKDIS